MARERRHARVVNVDEVEGRTTTKGTRFGATTKWLGRATDATTLRYLCLSTIRSGDIVGYPDSKKIAAVAAESYAKSVKGERWVLMLTREGAPLDYYDGETIE